MRKISRKCLQKRNKLVYFCLLYTSSGDDDDNADVAGEPYYEVAGPACDNTVYVSEDDLDAGEAICPRCV